MLSPPSSKATVTGSFSRASTRPRAEDVAKRSRVTGITGADLSGDGFPVAVSGVDGGDCAMAAAVLACISEVAVIATAGWLIVFHETLSAVMAVLGTGRFVTAQVTPSIVARALACHRVAGAMAGTVLLPAWASVYLAVVPASPCIATVADT